MSSRISGMTPAEFSVLLDQLNEQLKMSRAENDLLEKQLLEAELAIKPVVIVEQI